MIFLFSTVFLYTFSIIAIAVNFYTCMVVFVSCGRMYYVCVCLGLTGRPAFGIKSVNERTVRIAYADVTP